MTDEPESLNGRIRAIEAILKELPDVTVQVIEAAKQRLSQDARGRPGGSTAQNAELKERMGTPLDKHGEAALETFRLAVNKRKV